VGLNIPTEISDFSWWEIWSKKLEEAKIALPPVWVEGQVPLTPMLPGWRSGIVNTVR
jgi:hypothetical protein